MNEIEQDMITLGEDSAFDEWHLAAIRRLLEADKRVTIGNRVVISNSSLESFRSAGTSFYKGLPVLLESQTVPGVDFFLSTPSIDNVSAEFLRGHYLVYAAVLARHPPECLEPTPDTVEYRVYIGSASSKHGANERVTQWREGKMPPKYVLDSITRDEYAIVHVGILVAVPKPPVGQHPATRLWILMNEALLTFTLWSVRQSRNIKNDQHYLRSICPWDIHDLQWTGLNTHSPLAETPHGIEYTPEEITEIHAQTIERDRVRRKIYYEGHKDRYAFCWKIWRQTEKGIASAKASYLKYYHEGNGKEVYRKNNKAYKATERGREKSRAAARRRGKSDNDKALMKAWRASERGKALTAEYEQLDSTKARRKAYRESDAGKLRLEKYNQREYVKEAMKKGREKYLNSEHGKAARKATLKKYSSSEEAKAKRKAYAENYKLTEGYKAARAKHNEKRRLARAAQKLGQAAEEL